MKLLLALDEPGENDIVAEMDGYRFIIDKDLLDLAAPITIDSSFLGFTVHSDAISRHGGSCSI